MKQEVVVEEEEEEEEEGEGEMGIFYNPSNIMKPMPFN